MSLGLFGGAFNPLHYGHLALAREVQFRCNLEKMIFIPSGIPPHKGFSGLASAADRFKMVVEATKSHPWFETSDFETSQKKITYSIDTLKHFRKKIGEKLPLFLAMGIDTFLELKTWKNYNQLLQFCHLVVTNRSKFPWPDIVKESPFVLKAKPVIYDLNSVINEPEESHGKIFFMEIMALEISASFIRQRIDKDFPIEHLCPPEINQYIIKHNLYKPNLGDF